MAKLLKRDVIAAAKIKGYIVGYRGSIYHLCYSPYKHNGKMGVLIHGVTLQQLAVFIEGL